MDEKRTGAKLRLASGPVAVQVEINTFDLSGRRDAIADASIEISKSLDSATCAACVFCPHRTVECSREENPARMQQALRAKASCGMVRKVGHRHCPDGFDLIRGAFLHDDPEAISLSRPATFHTDEGFVASMMNHETLTERRKRFRDVVVKASQVQTWVATGSSSSSGPPQKITTPDEKSGWPVDVHSNGNVTLAIPGDFHQLIVPMSDPERDIYGEEPAMKWPSHFHAAPTGGSIDTAATIGKSLMSDGLSGMLSTPPFKAAHANHDFGHMMSPQHFPEDSHDVPQTEDNSVW